jgi:apolipoprotein N-acyltransferase
MHRDIKTLPPPWAPAAQVGRPSPDLGNSRAQPIYEADKLLLVTLPNDAWFGDSQEPWMHLALARLRAVEHRRLLVRSTNGGVSAVVDPSGGSSRRAVSSHARRSAPACIPSRAHALCPAGDWPGWVSAAAVVAFALAFKARGQR